MTISLDPAGELTAADVARIAAEDADRCFGCRVLDVRAGASNHLPGSVQVPVPGESLPATDLPAHLLPSRDHAFVVVAETGIRSRRVALWLRGRGYRAGYCRDGLPEGALLPGLARGEVWRPDAFLEECLPLLPPPDAGRVLELGAGSGRDGVFLAARGYDCLLVDRHGEALAMARDRATRLGVRVETAVVDLREPARVPGGPYALATSIRFLRRNVLAELSALLAPGGMFLLHTFTGDASRLAGHPRRQHLRLHEAELDRFFPAARWRRVRGPIVETSHDNAWIGVLLERNP